MAWTATRRISGSTTGNRGSVAGIWRRIPAHPAIAILLVSTLLVACGRGAALPPPVTGRATPEAIAPAVADATVQLVTPPPALTPLPPEPATPLPGVTSVVPDFLAMTLPEEVARQADLVVLGTTGDEQTTGLLPPGSPLVPPGPSGVPATEVWVYTETPVHVERVLKGRPETATVRVRTLGGTAGGISMAVTHEPELRVGQRVVLFLKQGEPDYYRVVGEDGVYDIVGQEAIGPRHRFVLVDLLKRVETAPSVATTAEPSAPAVSDVAGDPAVVQLLDDLRQRGVAPEPADVSAMEFLADAPGLAYRIASGWLNLHLYPRVDAEAKTPEIRRWLAHPTITWVAPPHAFRCDRLIALYFGTDEQVTQTFTELCGPQIAGSS